MKPATRLMFVMALLGAAQRSGAQSAADSSRTMSLKDAVALAQKNSPLAVNARGQLRSSRAGVRSSYAAFLPTFNIQATNTQNSPAGVVIDSTGHVFSGRWQNSQGFSTGLNLFDGLSRLYQIRASKAEVTAARANEVTQTFQIALLVSQQYYAVLAAKESESAARAQLDQAQQQLAVSRAKVRAQTSTKSDSLRAIIQVGDAKLALLQARNDLQTANATLTRLVGEPYQVTANAADTIAGPTVEIDSTKLVQLANVSPAVQQAQAAQVAAQAQYRAAHAPYFPNISVAYNRSRYHSDSSFNFTHGGYNYSGTLRFTVSYPLFNGLTREQDVVNADVARQNAEALAQDAALLAQQNLVAYIGTLRTAEQQIEIQQVSVVAAEEDLRVQQQRYQLGASILLDVLTSQTQLTQARLALIQARYDYRVAKAQLEALIGQAL
ncbi:MAG: TolC family protein [Gemmatimonadaceae bacterium]|nr:TolC family protein [Gemmatimonadaceae bacterium]